MLADGDVLPRASSITAHQSNPDYKDGLWAFVDFDIEPALMGLSVSILVYLLSDIIKKLLRGILK